MSDKAEKTLGCQDRLANKQTATAAAAGRTHTIEREKLPQKGNTNLR